MDKNIKKQTKLKTKANNKTIEPVKEPDENEINNVLMSIGKKNRNPATKEFVAGFMDKIKSKTEEETGKKPSKKIKGYDRPKSTFTDKLTKEDVEKKLEDYKKVEDLKEVPLGTHLRYFTKKDGELIFRMGGNLKNSANLPTYVILINAQNIEWSVQCKDTIFYKKMTIEEIKEEYENIISELNGKIKKLKEKIRELER